ILAQARERAQAVAWGHVVFRWFWGPRVFSLVWGLWFGSCGRFRVEFLFPLCHGRKTSRVLLSFNGRCVEGAFWVEAGRKWWAESKRGHVAPPAPAANGPAAAPLWLLACPALLAPRSRLLPAAGPGAAVAFPSAGALPGPAARAAILSWFFALPALSP
ncbi:unnamed protein product, partial [Effrenium voratum]